MALVQSGSVQPTDQDFYGTGTATNNALAEDDIDQPRDTLLQMLPPVEMGQAKKKTPKKRQTKAMRKQNQVQEILNSILPPREFIDRKSKKKYIQKVSPTPASRNDVVKLQVALDQRLQERQARENGICPVREELHSQCFDELLRQVTLNSQERGLLLLRVRDEVRMTIAAYQTLYRSSITFGMRKALQAEQGNAQLKARIAELEEKKKELQVILTNQKGISEAIDKRIQEQQATQEKKFKEEIDFLKYQSQHLEHFQGTLKNLNQP